MTSSYKVLNIPESASLALHAARAIIRAGEPLTAAEIAEVAGVSRHHLSKVLRKMVEAGIVSVSHGRGGGFFFTKEQAKLPLMRIMESAGCGAVPCLCMFDTPRCNGNGCWFGSLLGDVNKLYLTYFPKTKISNLQQKITD